MDGIKGRLLEVKESIKRAATKAGNKFAAFIVWFSMVFHLDSKAGEPGKIHHVKCETVFFEDVVNDRKAFEVRKNDRDYQIGDDMVLMEWDKALQEFTGREERVTIIYMLEGYPGIEAGYCILGIERY